eukprot:PhM_4_TR17268/c0_g1_i1/m.43512
MTRTAAKKKDEADFKTRKQKVGKKKLKPVNATQAEVHSAALYVRDFKANTSGDASLVATTHRGLSWKDCTVRMKHYSYKVQRDGLLQLHSLLKENNAVQDSLFELLSEVVRLVTSSDKSVRKSCIAVLKVALESYPTEVFTPFLLRICSAAISHIDPGVVLDAIEVLQLVLKAHLKSVPDTLPVLEDILKVLIATLPGVTTRFPDQLACIAMLFDVCPALCRDELVDLFIANMLPIWDAVLNNDVTSSNALRCLAPAVEAGLIHETDAEAVRLSVLACFEFLSDPSAKAFAAMLLYRMEARYAHVLHRGHADDEADDDDSNPRTSNVDEQYVMQLVEKKGLVISWAERFVHSKTNHPEAMKMATHFLFLEGMRTRNAVVLRGLAESLLATSRSHEFHMISNGLLSHMSAFVSDIANRSEAKVSLPPEAEDLFAHIPFVLFKLRNDANETRRSQALRDGVDILHTVFSHNMNGDGRLQERLQHGIVLFFTVPTSSGSLQFGSVLHCPDQHTMLKAVFTLLYLDEEVRKKCLLNLEAVQHATVEDVMAPGQGQSDAEELAERCRAIQSAVAHVRVVETAW